MNASTKPGSRLNARPITGGSPWTRLGLAACLLAGSLGFVGCGADTQENGDGNGASSNAAGLDGTGVDGAGQNGPAANGSGASASQPSGSGGSASQPSAGGTGESGAPRGGEPVAGASGGAMAEGLPVVAAWSEDPTNPGLVLSATAPTGGFELTVEEVVADAEAPGTCEVRCTVTRPGADRSVTTALVSLRVAVPEVQLQGEDGKPAATVRIAVRRIERGAHYFVAPPYEVVATRLASERKPAANGNR